MKKFSIIVAVYNVEKYLDKCLNSLVNQNYKDYELIVINDGSTDNSRDIIKKYEKEYLFVKTFDKENTGLSDTRNYGVTLAKGKYIIFIDGDDYVECDFLSNLSKYIDKYDYDIIKYQYRMVYDDHENIMMDNVDFDKQYVGEEFFNVMTLGKKAFEMAYIYAFNKKFWLDHNFKFASNRYHEDFGLIPMVILKAKSVICAPFIGYNYVQRENSIVHPDDYNKNIKRVNDILYHFDNMYKFIKSDKMLNIETKRLFNSYISNAVIDKINILNKDDQALYIKKLKKRHVFDLLQTKTIGQKLKKVYYKIKYGR